MNILIKLSSHLVFEGLRELLMSDEDSRGRYVVRCKATVGTMNPDIIIADYNHIDRKLFDKYPGAKIMLLDTGLKREDIAFVVSSYKIHGLLSTHTSGALFKKALQVVGNGEIWMDNNTVKFLIHRDASMPLVRNMSSTTEREREIISSVCAGCSNKEIAAKLSLSEQTVKAHLNRIFKKLGVSSRSKLITVVLNTKREI